MSDPRIIPVGAEPPPLEREGPRERRPPPPEKEKAATKQRFQVINAFADFGLAGLGRAEIAVWLILWRDTRDGRARTGQADIARRAGCCVRTVGRALKALEKARLVVLERQGGLNRGLSVYRVVAPPPREADCGRG